jgi:hypothetical protein
MGARAHCYGMRRSFFIGLTCAAIITVRSARAEDAPVVHVTFPSGGRLPVLERRDGVVWSSICMAPCDRPVAAGAEYRIVGLDGAPSDPFRMPADRRVLVDARVGGGPGVRTFGTIFVVGGLTFVGIGAVVAFLPASHDGAAKTIVGVGSMAVGAAFAAIGAFVIGLADTTVSVHGAP